MVVVGDVQGDVGRLEEGLRAYPSEVYFTVFLGDYFQGGEDLAAGGMASARFARSRENSCALLGNHELFILEVLEEYRRLGAPLDRTVRTQLVEAWRSRCGDWADLEELTVDADLEAWIRHLPAVELLSDGTLIQHCDGRRYLELGDSVEKINEAAWAMLATDGGARSLMPYLVSRHELDLEEDVDAYLFALGARRVLHGHTPHDEETPASRFGGKVIGYDGRFSRYWARHPGQAPAGPVSATIWPLDVLQSPAANVDR